MSWKKGVDFLPEFDMDYEKTTIKTIVEKKPVELKKDKAKKEGGEK